MCRHVGAAGVGLLLLTACAASDASDPEPPPIGGEESEDGDAEEADPESVEEEDEPYAVPDEIDEAYAEDVINVLLEIESEAIKIALQQEPGDTLAVEAADRFHAMAAGGRLEFLMETYQLYIDKPELADGFVPVDEMGTTRFEADGILHSEPENCLLVVGWWDRTELAAEPPVEQSLVSLGRLDRAVTDIERNPTPWQIREISPMMLIDDEPVPQERWDDINFGDELDRTCDAR